MTAPKKVEALPFGSRPAVVADFGDSPDRDAGPPWWEIYGIFDQMIRSVRKGALANLLVLIFSPLRVPSACRAWAQTSPPPDVVALKPSDPFALPLAKSDRQQPSLVAAGLVATLSSASSAFGADSAPSQGSSVGNSGSQTSSSHAASANDPPQASKDETSGFSVNPVTGLVSASAANYQPLTGSQRVKLYFKQNFWSVGAYFGPVAAALLLDQTTDSPSQWGGGFSGYGKRVASRMAAGIVQGSVQAPLAALLHDDVRYIVSKEQGVKRRTWHAVVYSFATYNNHGHPTANIANIASYYGASAVSATWLPGYHNVARYALIDGSESLGLSIPVNILQEFWPDVRRYVFRRP